MTIVAQTPPAGQDAAPAIQAAIDQALAQGGGEVVVPRGVHTLFAPLRLFSTGAKHWLSTVTFRGEERAYGSRAPGTLLIAASPDAPALVLQSARAVRIADLKIQGAYLPPINNSLAALLDPATFAPGAFRDNRRSPHAGIVVDALHPSVPQADRYPALASLYDVPSEVAGSSDVVFDRVTIDGFLVGCGVSVSGYSQNAENLTWIDCGVGHFKVGLAICQPQSRACWWVRGGFGFGDTAFDGVTYGEQSGKEPHIDGCNVVWTRRLFNSLAAGEATVISGLRCETCFDFGIVRSAGSTPMEIVASTLSFAATPVGSMRPPTRIANLGRVLTFRGGSLGIAGSVAEAVHAYTTSRIAFDGSGIAQSGWSATQAPLLWCSESPHRLEYRGTRMNEVRGANQNAALLDLVVREASQANLSGSQAQPGQRSIAQGVEAQAPLAIPYEDFGYRDVVIDGAGGAEVSGAAPAWTPALAAGDLIYSLTPVQPLGFGAQWARLVLGEVAAVTPTIKLRHVHGLATSGSHRLFRVRLPRWT